MLQDLNESTPITNRLKKRAREEAVNMDDQLSDIQAANAFLQHAVTSGHGFALTQRQQSGFSYIIQKINDDIETLKTQSLPPLFN